LAQRARSPWPPLPQGKAGSVRGWCRSKSGRPGARCSLARGECLAARCSQSERLQRGRRPALWLRPPMASKRGAPIAGHRTGPGVSAPRPPPLPPRSPGLPPWRARQQERAGDATTAAERGPLSVSGGGKARTGYGAGCDGTAPNCGRCPGRSRPGGYSAAICRSGNVPFAAAMGTMPCTMVPFGLLRICRLPPNCRMRAVMPAMPTPVGS